MKRDKDGRREIGEGGESRRGAGERERERERGWESLNYNYSFCALK